MQRLRLKNRYIITPNVADTHRFCPTNAVIHKTKKQFIHVSCFDEPAKNIKGIINVFENLSRQRNDFELTIIGTGPDVTDIIAHAEKTGLNGRVIYFTGLLEGDALQNRMKSADAMVMFSNYENLPCTIVESICCGVPVISTDVGGIKEHLNATNGILVKAGDESMLEKAILQILNNQFKTDKEAIRNYGESHFSMNAVSDLFESVYGTAPGFINNLKSM